MFKPFLSTVKLHWFDMNSLDAHTLYIHTEGISQLYVFLGGKKMQVIAQHSILLNKTE